MSLIHESVGEIVYDSEHRLKNGTKVVMIPNTPSKPHNIIAENYLTSSHFKSSGYDGFMQDYIVMKLTIFLNISKLIMHLNAWVVKEVSRLLNKLLILLILKGVSLY